MAILRRATLAFPRQYSDRQVPTWPVEINPNHRLGLGLKHCVPFVGGVDLAGNGPVTVTGGTFAATPFGPGVGVTGGAGSNIMVPGAPLPDTTTGFSAAVLWVPTSYSGNFSSAFERGTSVSVARDFGVYVSTAGAVDFYEVGSATLTNPTGTMAAGVPSMFVASCNTSFAVTSYINGVSTGPSTASGSFDTRNNWYFGYNASGGGVSSPATYVAFFYWNRPLAADEVALLNARPFSMLRPVIRRGYYISSSGTGVTPGLGSVAIAGSAPTVAYDNSLTPGAGSIVFTGNAPSPNQAGLPGVGSVVFTGAAPALTRGNTALPGAGSAVLTGSAPTLAYGTSLVPGVGSVVLTGQAASVGATVFPSVGSAVLIGAAPTVTFTILPGAGSAVLTGKVPTIAFGVSVLPGAGSIVVFGLAPTLAYGNALTPGSGAIVFTGFAPPASGSTNANPGVGAVVFAGKVPLIAAGVSLVPGAGSVVFGGLAPTKAAGNTVAPGVGAIALGGLAPSVSSAGSPTNASPAAGSVIITGSAPVVVYGTAVLPGFGAVMIAGAAPSVVAGALGITIVPGVGLVLFGCLSPSVLTAPAPTLLTNALYIVSVPGVLRTVSAPPPLRIVSVPGVNRTAWRSTSMAQAAQLSSIDVGETDTVTFDFASVLAAGEVLSGTPNVICTVSAASTGSDATPATRLVGTPAIGPSPSTGGASLAVRQQIGGMLGGVTYTLQCIATAAPDTPSLWARVACVQPN